MNRCQSSGSVAVHLLAGTSAHLLELPAAAGLAGVVHAVGEPHGERGAAEGHAQVDHRLVVLHRELAHAGVGARHGAELVGDGAVARGRGVVLERVRVRGVEPDAERLGVGLQARRGRRVVHGTWRLIVRLAPVSALRRGDVVDLLLGGAGLALAGNRPKRVPPVPTAHEGAPMEQRATSAITASASILARAQLGPHVVEVGLVTGDEVRLDVVDRLGGDAHRHDRSSGWKRDRVWRPAVSLTSVVERDRAVDGEGAVTDLDVQEARRVGTAPAAQSRSPSVGSTRATPKPGSAGVTPSTRCTRSRGASTTTRG